MVYRLTIVFTISFFLMTIAFYNVEFYALLSYLMALAIASVSLIYLLLTKRYKNLYLFYAIVGSFIAHFSCNFSLTTSHYVDIIWMITCSFLAFVGVGKKSGVTLLVLNAIGISFFIFFTHNKHIATIKEFSAGELIGAYVEISLAFFIIAYLMYQFISFQNYAEEKLLKANLELAGQNTIIKSKNSENSTLLKEIHHRVKNNLQIIVSLLRLQQSEIKSNETREQFTEAINRVMVMASIHQRLYQEKEVAKIDLQSYLSDLADDLKKIFQNDKMIHVNIESNYKEIDLKTVVPLGLLLNELISNSYKYAFDSMQNREINILIAEKRSQFLLTYSDNGKWIEKQEKNSGFGLDLINIFTEQLNGSFEFETGETGTKYQFLFSKLQ